MTDNYEAKLEKLRSMGVVDMTLSFGCEFLNQKGILIKIGDGYINNNKYITAHIDYTTVSRLDLNASYFGKPIYSTKKIGKEKIDKISKILGHPLTIGRCLWWIEKNNEIHQCRECGSIEEFQHILVLRHDKDKPLSEQENREEICDLIINLGK